MNYTKKVLENGVRVFFVPHEGQSATFLVMAETGSKYETKKQNGLSHFVEHMIFKGTKNRPDAKTISSELDSLGADYNAFTSQEYTGYYAKTATRFFDKAVDIISDIYLNSTFPAKEIEKEKGVIVEEIRMYKDLPHRQVENILLELVYGDTPAGRDVAGTEETVKSFNQNDFLEYFKDKYTSEASMIVVAGNFDQEKVYQTINNTFGKLEKNKKPEKEPVVEKQDKPALKIENKDTDQTHLILAFRSFGILDPRLPVIRVLSGILGGGMSSRLFIKLREEMGVCYYVRSSSDISTDHGLFMISAGVDKSRFKEVLEVLLEETKNLKEKLVDEKELRKVKDHIIGSLALSIETSNDYAQYISMQEVLKKRIDTIEEQSEKIEKVTAEEIKNLANELFIEKNINLAVIGKGYIESEILPLLKI